MSCLTCIRASGIYVSRLPLNPFPCMETQSNCAENEILFALVQKMGKPSFPWRYFGMSVDKPDSATAERGAPWSLLCRTRHWYSSSWQVRPVWSIEALFVGDQKSAAQQGKRPVEEFFNATEIIYRGRPGWVEARDFQVTYFESRGLED
jgi:hypothetical protein